MLLTTCYVDISVLIIARSQVQPIDPQLQRGQEFIVVLDEYTLGVSFA